MGVASPDVRPSASEPQGSAERRLQAALQATPDMVLVLSKDGNFLDFKPPEAFPSPFSIDEVLGKNVAAILPAGLAEQMLHSIEQALETGQTQVYQYEVPVKGKMRSYEGRMAAAGGSEAFALVRDVTERRRADEALRLAVEGTSTALGGQFFRSLVKHLAAATNVRYAFVSQVEDPDGKRLRMVCLWTGDGYKEEFEYDVQGSPCESVVGRQIAYFSAVAEVFPEAPGWLKELAADTYLAIPLIDSSGHCLGHMGVMHDGPMYQVLRAESILKIFAALAAAELERRRAEEALRHTEEEVRQAQKMEAIGRLAGGMAHDFNNLLTAINGYADLVIRRLDKDHPMRGDVEEIRKAGERAESLTRQLLAFSRRQVLQPKVLDLNHVVGNVHQMLRRLIGEDIDLILALDPGLGRVKADPGQLEQILMNLAVNARDAMPHGGRLIVETANVFFDRALDRGRFLIPRGRYVMLAVSDNGVGMDKETQAHIFEPFFTTKPKGQGTGLGLSTVYGIVKQSGGTIWVYSEPEHGSTFKIYLPRVDEDVEVIESGGPQIEIPRGTGTVLLVEDEEGVRSLARRVLEGAGYTVLEAPDAGRALEISRGWREPIDLILTDVVMPELSGFELAERLQFERPEIRVLFMSGYTDEAILCRGVECGRDFLQKPFTSESLVRKVREALGCPH